MSDIASATDAANWIWNWYWNCGADAAAPTCSNCNLSIALRVLSPGDNGDVTQTNAATSASAAAALLAAAERTAAGIDMPTAPAPEPAPEAAPAPVDPPAAAPPAPDVQHDVAPAPAAEVEPATTATPAGWGPAATAGSEARPADAARPGAATGIAAVPPARAVEPRADVVGSAPRHQAPAPRVHHLRRARARAAATEPLVTPTPLPAPPSREQAAPVARAHVSAVGGRTLPDRSPLPLRPPLQLPGDGAAAQAASGHGDGPSSASTAALLALLAFIAPGFAPWLWAAAGTRPRPIWPRRPERPG
jgi:hypothetical protein